ncbi:MAG: hypothetical protein SF051_15980 [Elusimicrobiota bacterium]|nr:hypothetical protein [Elusimicrobiota bacterium]
MNALLPFLLATVSFAASPLVGTWNKDGSVLASLKADGSGVVRGETVRWRASADTLTLVYEEGEVETMTYKLAGDALTVTMDGQTEVYTRAGAKKPAAKGAAAAPAGSDSLSKLLLSSAWCHFRYNQHAGTTKQERVVFRADGTWTSGARGETYSSGRNGTAYGQSDSASGGRWQAKGGRLFLSEAGAAPQDAGLTVTRNSNGYPILNADGKEYSQCR